MSTKETLKAANLLQNMFGPVVEALPALITQLEQTDAAEKQLKKLENEYNALVKKFNAKVDAIEKLDADLAKRNDARQAELKALEANSTAVIKDLQKKQRDLTSKINEKQKELESAERDSAGKVAAAEKLGAEQVAAVQASTSARIEEMNAATAEAEKKYADTVKKLEALKSKL